MSQPCGCADREGHVDPTLDVDLGLGHGERSAMNDDPLPHAVPGTGGWNGLYVESPDAYCLCGHPNYMTCVGQWEHGLASMTIHRADPTTPSCGEPGYERCPDCQAHRTEPHLAGCPVLGRSLCFWCDGPAVGHDVNACRLRAQAAPETGV